MGYENIRKGGEAWLVLVDGRPGWRGLIQRIVFLSNRPEKFKTWATLAAVPVVPVNANAEVVGPIPPGPFLDAIKAKKRPGPGVREGETEMGVDPKVAAKIAGFPGEMRSNHVWQVICNFGVEVEKC